jgi:Bacterial alpha-L-rhamnosidase 6 hairpin glycosidase domain
MGHGVAFAEYATTALILVAENSSFNMAKFLIRGLVALNCLSLTRLAGAGVPYSEYILAPSSRTVYPSSVFKINGTVTNADSLTQASGGATFQGPSAVTFDFSKNIGGFVSLTVGSSSSPNAALAIAYTESSEWISGYSSDGTQNGVDQLIYLPVGQGPGTYTVDKDHERGGFRYLSLISNTSDTINVSSVSVNFTAAPAQQDLQAYAGYFHSNDEVLNRIWYAGAYTCQLCSIDPTRGNAVINFPAGTHVPGIEIEVDEWYFNYTISNGTSVLTDGAKRDRLVWPGDMAISIPTVFVSTNDMQTIRNSLDSLYVLQMPDGILPYAGMPLPSTTSWTYHLHNLIGADDYYTYTGDMDYLSTIWDQWKLGVQWSLSSIDSSGLMEVGASADWLRGGMGGHVRLCIPCGQTN